MSIETVREAYRFLPRKVKALGSLAESRAIFYTAQMKKVPTETPRRRSDRNLFVKQPTE